MNQRRVLFYSIFAGYQLLAFIFTLIMESDTGFLFKLVGYVKWFKFATFFGLILIVVDFVWYWMETRTIRKEQESMRHENNTLKAKVYDFQEAAKEQAKTISTPKP